MIHMVSWEERCAAAVRDIDAWNAARVAPFHSIPVGEAKAHFEATHQQLTTLGRSFPNATADLGPGCYPGHLTDLIQLRALAHCR